MILTLNVFSILNLVFLAFILLVKKNISKADRFFALIAIIPAFAVILNLSIYYKLDFKYQLTFYFIYHFNLLWAPFFYRYVLLKIGKSLKLTEIIVHYIPFGACLIISILSLLNILPSSIASNYENNLLIDYVITIQIFVYLGLMLVFIRKYKKAKLNYFSDEVSISITWIYEIILIYIFLGFMAFAPIIFDLSFKYCMILLPISIQAYFFFVIYKAFGYSIVFEATPIKFSLEKDFATINENLNENIDEEKDKIICDRNLHTKEHIDSFLEERYQKVVEYIEKQKPYLEPEINLTKLASALEENTHNLSLTINQKFKMSFYDLINSYRIKEVQRLLKDNQSGKLTIESIAFDAGFNTPSSFYRAFKKHTQITPSQYLKSIQANY